MKNIMMDVAFTIETEKEFEKLTKDEIISALLIRVSQLILNWEPEAIGFSDEYREDEFNEEAQTLVINDVDLGMLDGQRKVLVGWMMRMDEQMIWCPPEVKDALDGVINMLDGWSDKRAEKKPFIPQEEIAAAMTDAMNSKDMWEIVYQDNLKTLNDCTEEELREYEDTYWGKVNENGN